MRKIIAAIVAGFILGAVGTVTAAPTVQAVFAKFNFVIDGKKVDPGVDPLVYQGTTYLPVRVFSNMLGYDVVYRADSRTIEFYTANPVQLNPSEEEQTLAEEKTMLTGRELVELLAKKYPQYADTTNPQIYLSPDGTLKIGENIYHVTIHENRYVDVSPLIEDGVLSNKDIQ